MKTLVMHTSRRVKLKDMRARAVKLGSCIQLEEYSSNPLFSLDLLFE